MFLNEHKRVIKDMKFKSVLTAIIGGTIVIYFIKPFLDLVINFLKNTSLKLFSGWQNGVYKKIPLADSSELSLNILLFVLLAIVVCLFLFGDKVYKKYRKIQLLTAKSIKVEESKVKKEITDDPSDLRKIEKEWFVVSIFFGFYFLFVVGFFVLFFAERTIILNEHKRYTCKITLLEVTSDIDIVNLSKLKWMKTQTKIDNFQFHEFVDSVLLKNNIDQKEYCE